MEYSAIFHDMDKRFCIIGGGASGLICAIFCAKSSISVDLFEQNEKCAKKILACPGNI